MNEKVLKHLRMFLKVDRSTVVTEIDCKLKVQNSVMIINNVTEEIVERSELFVIFEEKSFNCRVCCHQEFPLWRKMLTVPDSIFFS